MSDTCTPWHSLLVRLSLAALLTLSLSACGGDNDNSGGKEEEEEEEENNPPPPEETDDISISFVPGDSISAREPLVVTFSESMNPDSLSLEGSLAGTAQAEWSSEENENDTLTLVPMYYWPPGSRTLQISAVSSEGESASGDATLEVGSAFVNGHEASTVIGQTSFTAGESRQGGDFASANTLDEPLGAPAYSTEQDILFVADTWDARLLGFHGIPEQNNPNADFVLGQPGFHSSSGATTRDGMVSPQYVTTDHGRLIVTDTENYRVTIYGGIPQGGGALPDVVVGQPDFETRIQLNNADCDDRTLNHSHAHLLTESGMFLVAASWQNRVLIWDQLPTENYQPADRVLGQPNLTTCADIPNSGTFRHPTEMWTDEEKLIIVDSEKHRVLIWNTFPTGNFESPDIILGQQNLRNEAPNDDNQDGERDAQASARVLDYPRGVWVEHGQLFVADMNNHRILVWNEIPEESFAPADIVIGQDSFSATGGSREDGVSEDPTSASTFNSPTGVRIINDKLFVTERFNHRVLIFEAR